ncbi:iron complex transport system substrate-binding protein [Ureibacillus xyleni]|uniref:Iron complex transport system substrate-binding protein n=1 Tax=Ureibacillus xyleni TaxID=614648 RepID=A0A285TFC4_9BACL|nr:iron complex transport system substrate-binding protein [Ureibacillus xyleni]
MKIYKKWLAAFVFTILLVGCNSEDSNKAKNDTPNEATYTVEDDRGVEVTFEAIPQSVISLQPSNTEILFELGVGDKLIGATEYDTYPEEAKKIERVSDTITVNNERVIELNPDVVFAFTMGDETQVEQLESAGIKVFVIKSAASIEDVYGDIKQIAEVMGVEKEGQKVVANIQSQITSVQEKIASLEKQKKVYFEISPAPDIWSVGSGTFQQELIYSAGVENLYIDQQGWFAVSEEDLLQRNPEAIITTVNSEDPIAEMLSRPGWGVLTAVQNKEVYHLNADILDRPGPRIGEAVELIATSIYPDLFK